MRCLSRHVKAWPLVACLCGSSLLVATTPAWAADTKSKKAAKDVASDDGNLQNTLSWEDKVMGPETNKKIDLKKIEELQAKEKARREKAEKDEKERKEREAAQAAQRKDVAAPATKEVEVEEAPVPAKPAVKHDDAFVDKLMNDKSAPKKKAVSQGPDDVDQLLAKVKDNKAPSPTGRSRNDSVDQLLTSAEKQPTRTTVTRPSAALQTTKSDEEAAREEALRALAAAQAKLAAERAKQKQQPAVPDAAVLKARMAAENGSSAPVAPAPKKGSAPTLTTSSPAATTDTWSDPFATGDSARGRKGAVKHGKGPANGAKGGWGDPFDSGAGKARPAGKAGKGQKKTKDPNWNDPFA